MSGRNVDEDPQFGSVFLIVDDIARSLEFARLYAPDYEPVAHGRVGLSFQLASPAGVDALFERLRSLGHRVDRTPWDAPTSFRYAIVYDPDGNPVHIYSPLPESQKA